MVMDAKGMSVYPIRKVPKAHRIKKNPTHNQLIVPKITSVGQFYQKTLNKII